jgi:ParB family chromosome partitioning protein
MVPTSSLREDPNNPRTEFPEAELEELVEDIRQYGILLPIVVHPVDAMGRYQIHFGAKRWRAAQFAELQQVPVVVRELPADPYTQVAENQKRHGLMPLDLARFIRGRVDAGDSNATVAERLGMNLTTVAHHLALLKLPPELDEALKSGRCTSPPTLHELSMLHGEKPEQVRALVAGGAEITRPAMSSMRAERLDAATNGAGVASTVKRFAQANAACDRLERALRRIDLPVLKGVAEPELMTLRARITDLANRWR